MARRYSKVKEHEQEILKLKREGAAKRGSTIRGQRISAMVLFILHFTEKIYPLPQSNIVQKDYVKGAELR